MLNSSLSRALVVAVVGTGLVGWFTVTGLRGLLSWMLGIAVVLAAGALLLQLGRWLGGRLRHLHERSWADLEGRHHSFAGVSLRIEDDGRHVWVDGAGLMRATGQVEPEEALAARHAGRWRRAADHTLMLRVDDVVRQLATGRDRDAPRIQRLRRYLERDVLFPAAQRRLRT